MKRSLSLKKETLAALGDDELGSVAGGSAGPTCYSCLTICGICHQEFEVGITVLCVPPTIGCRILTVVGC